MIEWQPLLISIVGILVIIFLINMLYKYAKTHPRIYKFFRIFLAMGLWANPYGHSNKKDLEKEIGFKFWLPIILILLILIMIFSDFIPYLCDKFQFC